MGLIPDGERIVLTVEASCENESTCFEYEIYLAPETLNEEESFFRNLDEALSGVDEKVQAKNNCFFLPSLAEKTLYGRRRKQGPEYCRLCFPWQ